MKFAKWAVFISLTAMVSMIFLFQNCGSGVKFDEVSQASALQVNDSTGALQGTVLYSQDGSKIAGVTVDVYNSAGSAIVATAVTNSAGYYSVNNLVPNNYLVTFSKSNYITIANVPLVIAAGEVVTLNETLTSALPDGQIRIVLTWCDERAGAVRDVDSYLQIPGASTILNFQNMAVGNATLDHDETQWRGPETITIANVAATGTYTYWVNNYNARENLTALGKSDLTIKVYRGAALVKSYSVPQGSGYTYRVFKIVNGVIQDSLGYDNTLYVVQ